MRFLPFHCFFLNHRDSREKAVQIQNSPPQPGPALWDTRLRSIPLPPARQSQRPPVPPPLAATVPRSRYRDAMTAKGTARARIVELTAIISENTQKIDEYF